jgi:hypothetical protein
VLSSENSRWRIGACLPPGQAGCVFWPHGEDQMSMWLEGELRTVHFGAVEDYPICGLVLEPLPGVF